MLTQTKQLRILTCDAERGHFAEAEGVVVGFFEGHLHNVSDLFTRDEVPARKSPQQHLSDPSCADSAENEVAYVYFHIGARQVS